MTGAEEIAVEIERNGYAIVPGVLDPEAVATARAELGGLLADAPWGTGFDGVRTKRVWAPVEIGRAHV